MMRAGKFLCQFHAGLVYYYWCGIGIVPIGHSAAAHDDDFRAGSEI